MSASTFLLSKPLRDHRQGLNAERQLRGRPDVHLLAYPNSGEAWDASARAWRSGTGLSADAFGASAAGWADAGATLVGGELSRLVHSYI